jgi:hypothetical protein
MSTKQMSFEEALALVQQARLPEAAARLGRTYYDPTLRRALDIVVKNPRLQPTEEKPEPRREHQ